jgi:cell division protein FtsQ
MMRSRRPRKNQLKSERTQARKRRLNRVLQVLVLLIGLGLAAAASTMFVFIHDFLTQWEYFQTRELVIEGNQRLSKAEVAAQAQVGTGVNIFAVNLSLTRKRLLAHPWIAEAEVSRQIPSGIRIRIYEHRPLAIVELGHRFLIDENGTLFKEWDSSDPANLPLISGLELSDVAGVGNPVLHQAAQDRDVGAVNRPSPFEAVMWVLKLGADAGSILPNGLIQQIQVDRELGLTLQVMQGSRIIHLGYGDYLSKYTMLKTILSRVKQTTRFPDLIRIDLNNPERVVVRPLSSTGPGEDHKEV